MLTFFQYFSASFGIVVFLFLTAQIIQSKLNTLRTILLSLLLGLLALIKAQFDWESTTYLLLNIGAFAAMLCVCAFGYQEKLLKRCIVFGYFMIVWGLSDAASYTLFSLHYGDLKYVLSETTPFLLYVAFSITTNILMGSVSVLAWRMIAARKFQPFFLLFFILPIGQLITVYSFTFSTWTVLWLLGILLSLVADLVLLVYTISQEKKTVLEEELRETRYMMELEQSHYKEIEKHRDELSRIRHDFNNQLATIGQLIRAQDENSAQNMIHALSEEIAVTNENPYCDIPVVNAILTEKARDCAAAGIGLMVDLDFSNPLSVEQMHLCSIFGNLIDNAINACKQINHTNTPAIQLNSMADGDYLFIKTVNPSDEPPMKPALGHGYGSRILSELAARYGGDYRTEYQDGIFTAVVSLLAVGGA